MAAVVRALSARRSLPHRRRRRLRSAPPARIDSLPARPRLGVIAVDGLRAGLAGAGTLGVWSMIAGPDTIGGLTWAELPCLILVGIAASALIAFAEGRPALGFGVVMLFVVVTALHLFATMMVADPRPHAAATTAVGNVAATAAIALVLWRRRHRLVIWP